MTGPQKLSKLSAEEYLSFEKTAAIRHEYVNGRIFAMTGGTRAHNIIALNIASTLRNLLKGSGCTVFITDMKVRANAANCFYYPDVMVDCKTAEKSSIHTETPTAIFEVLSKSTAAVDRREKLVAYQMIPSLQSYVIVHQSRKRVEHYRRAGEDWTLEELTSSGELILECNANKNLPLTLSLDEVYAELDFEEGPDLLVREDAEVYAW